ncbi:Uncharacterized protein dnm_067520 [Desulfonema magnum]|uniref:Uncharacterized protein n=1 Tax=Desulfonema magnum TaxID=45655 RepID=A0A975BS59_9BACT|nr:Uncharacterized protein dnm_067520 [Desulfonema magnum]
MNSDLMKSDLPPSPQRHKDTKKTQRDFVRLCAFVPLWQI